MELMPAKSWKSEFARSTEAERYREIVRKHQEEVRRKNNDKDQKDREERGQALDDMAFVVMATQTDIDAYLVTTAHYQEATYEAIIQNEQLLSAALVERQQLLDKAFVLPDGRRVFESEDGLRVFDEHGEELDPSEITPEDIEDWRPRLEEWKRNGDTIVALEDERAKLIEYQQKIDEAQERLEDGDISQQDFDALKKDLTETMPDRVRDLLPDEFKPERKQQQTAELTINAAPVSRPGPVPMMDVP
jgi:hypothetical protein